MSIIPTNIAKNTISPIGESRGISYLWGDTVRTWGDAVATWGYAYSVTNVTKNTPSSTTISIGSPIGLLLTLTYSSTISFGGGWVNQSKS